MNDIRLIHTTEPHKWDWAFGWNDVDVVRGDLQLVNAVKHAVLLRRGELLQEVYSTKGCTVADHVYRANSDVEREEEAQSIEIAATSVNGVYSAECTLHDGEEYESNIELHLLTDTMEEVIIREI